jgi:glycosyltransferase involved in cell wall biosynthesis
LKSLDKILSKHVELHVAFEYPRYIEDFEHKGIYFHPITPNSELKSKFVILRSLIFDGFIDEQHKEKYISIIKKVNPDIIHIHGTENAFSVILKYDMLIPVVLSIQGNSTVYNYKFFDGLPKSLGSMRNFNSLRSFFMSKPYSKVFCQSTKGFLREQKYFKLHKNIIGRTDWDRRITSILSPGRNYFHNDEVLREEFYLRQWKFNNQFEEVVIHSTIGSNYFKGIEVILMASHLLKLNGLRHKWKIAGISSDELIVKIAKRHLNIGEVDSQIIYLGNLDESELSDQLLNSHIYVMPSHIENSPNNLCEAMILGMPCIATHAGGTSSLITDKEDGLLIQTGDPWSMSGAILELCSDFERAIELGRNARQRAIKRHNKEKIVFDLVQIYSEVLGVNKNLK